MKEVWRRLRASKQKTVRESWLKVGQVLDMVDRYHACLVMCYVVADQDLPLRGWGWIEVIFCMITECCMYDADCMLVDGLMSCHLLNMPQHMTVWQLLRPNASILSVVAQSNGDGVWGNTIANCNEKRAYPPYEWRFKELKMLEVHNPWRISVSEDCDKSGCEAWSIGWRLSGWIIWYFE